MKSISSLLAWGLLIPCVAVPRIFGTERLAPGTFFVDSASGQDESAGTSPETAWRTLDKVNQASLIPGDKVLFKRGGLWRGQLVPRSGAPGKPVTYSAYGEGEKPVIQGSIDRSRTGDWVQVKPGIWATLPVKPVQKEVILSAEGAEWSSSFQGPAKGSVARVEENGESFVRVTCKAAGTGAHEIQLWGPKLTKATAPCLMLRLRARCSVPFRFGAIQVTLPRPPWTNAARGNALAPTAIGKEWQEFDVLLTRIPETSIEESNLHLSLGALLAAGAVFDFECQEVRRAELPGIEPVSRDAGIFIVDHGRLWGIKKWSLEDLQKPLDYWYDAHGQRVFVACEQNPAQRFKSIELALTTHIVNQGGKADLVYDGLAVRYGGAHGFGGGSTKRITIRNCDVYWIGGGLQFFKPDGKPVRFGNGIEFWGAAEDHLVEKNRLWEIYDAALTNQGRGKDSIQRNIVYRDNVIWNAEYSFEYWNGPKEAITENILFENNTCVDAGTCWSHAQRPNPNGAHLMFYSNPAPTANFVVRNNVFVQSTEVCVRFLGERSAGMSLSGNLYWQEPGKPVIRVDQTSYPAAEFAAYQSTLKQDTGSLVAEPQFMDAAHRDYRLRDKRPYGAQR